jgi:hypothetical protein
MSYYDENRILNVFLSPKSSIKQKVIQNPGNNVIRE